ncbi:MAG: ABC transporter permease [Gracilimonas sp.]|uniref:ABC transporter permease n=1 Tax=Gracilimonas sp. TaxID=1974203 RepID=UPI001B124225|nr:ABC transporter permease [Gracilimonas sp.]MBO6585361.1 ABC transporter permease [Gracilimonas sp.]MBO6616357.1 ABC transporter permease [Gracilimonas sp.]
MLKNYFKIAFRNISKHKGYSFINISGLAIGIACCLLILIYVRHELSYDQFHKKADRIVRISMESGGDNIAVTPSMVAPTLNQISPEIERWVRLYEPTRYSPAIISTGENKFQEDSFLYADSSFFQIFSFDFIAGNPETALKNPRSLVLPKSTALKLFGSVDVLGETVNARIFNTNYDFEVTGVIENVPANSHFTFNYLGSLHTMSSWSQLDDSQIRAANFFTYLLLNSSSSTESLRQTANAFIRDNQIQDRVDQLIFTPVTELYLNSNFDFEIAPMGSMQNVIGFIFLALMVLLIATINYVNLSTARSSRRGAEVGIRKALGAVKSQLVKQFYGESILITLISVVLALILVEFFKEPFFQLMGKDIGFNLFTDPSAWMLLAGVTIITAALAGSYPAFLLSSYQPVRVLKGLLGSTGSDGTLRKGLVISQFAISTFLILCTVIIYQQTNFILTADLGFDDDEVIVLPARDNELAQKQDLLKSEVLRQPGVKGATYMSNIPGKVFGGYGSVHNTTMEPIGTAAGAADADLVQTLDIEVIAGTSFPDSPSYTREQGYVYLINEQLAQAHGWSPQEAIGKPFNVLGGREGEVVGVMADFNYQSLRENVEPLALFIHEQMYNYLLVKVEPGNIQGTIASLENMWQDVAPHRPFEFEFLDQQLNALYQSELQTRNLLLAFSGLAIFIACLGLVGLSSFLIERRAKEIGIRKVLGASVSKIVALLSTDFLKLVAIGFVVGTPIAWYVMDQWLTNFAYRIDMNVAVFITVGLIAMIIAILTVSWQSIKAAVANPVDSLRSE